MYGCECEKDGLSLKTSCCLSDSPEGELRRAAPGIYTTIDLLLTRSVDRYHSLVNGVTTMKYLTHYR